MDQVTLHALSFKTIIGILDHERTTPQPIEIDVTLELDLLNCGRTGNLELGVDYAEVMDELMFLAKAGEFELLESFCLCACSVLLHPPHRTAPSRVKVAAKKPLILAPHTTPSVTMSADAKRVGPPSEREAAPGVQAATLLSTDTVRIERLSLSSGVSWKSPSPCCAHQFGVPLSAENREQAVLRRVHELVATDAASHWLIVTRLNPN